MHWVKLCWKSRKSIIRKKSPQETSEAKQTSTSKQAKQKKTQTSNERSKANIHKQASEAEENTNEQRAKQCCVKASRSGLTFLPWSGGAFRSVKNKKLFERSEFFLFSGEKCRSRQKSADGEFSLFRFFCSGKRNEKPLRLEQQRSAKALAAWATAKR